MIQETPKANILVVDDTPTNLRLLVEILQEQGYLARPVPSGKFALTAAQGFPPDLILLDIMMPEMSGYEVCQALKSDARTQAIPVIFISALNEPIDKVRAFSVGGVDYITKPFQIDEILARVQTHLQLSSLQKYLQQKTEALTNTLETLKVTQHQLVQTEKMAALGQLIAGIAHEINTPMGAIRSSIENITDFLDTYFLSFADLFPELEEGEYQLLKKIMLLNQATTNNLSTREKRQIKRQIIQQLQQENIEQPDIVADTLVDLGIFQHEQLTELLPYLLNLEGREVLNIAYRISSLKVSSTNILAATEKASKIVFALKNYSRTEMSDSPIYANVTDGIETVLTLYYNQTKRGIEVVKNYQKTSPILCYPDELNQVWTNLISNAIHALNNQGTLTISVRQEGQEVQVSIADDGGGIPAEIQGKIFEPFFTTKPRGEGTGLGLDIVKKIVEKHQGKIELNSLPKSTIFTVYLPIELKLSP